jgi:protein-S-isoprenylcysteine O-methyltransferase Ste14
MIGEIALFGVFAPAALIWAIAAGLLVVPLRRALLRTGFYRLVWHPGLFDMALFVLLWGGIAALAGLGATTALP